jgi:hypothetical protein
MGLFPKMPSGFKRVDFEILPPLNLLPSLMKLSMVIAAERHGELIANLQTYRPRLRNPLARPLCWVPAQSNDKN